MPTYGGKLIASLWRLRGISLALKQWLLISRRGVRIWVLGCGLLVWDTSSGGGSPMAFDRLLATRLGAAAVRELHEGNYGQIVGLIGNEIVLTPLEDLLTRRKELDLSLCELSKIMEK